MHSPALIAVVAVVLSQTASGSPLPSMVETVGVRQNDPHKADFRTFGVAGCHDENQGVYTLLASDADKCRRFVEPIGSFSLTDNECTLTVYADSDCAVTPAVALLDTCMDGNWQSYKLTC